MNHKWKYDVCVKCGIKREKRERQVLDHTYPRLGRDGIWYDAEVWTLRRDWAFSFDGGKWLFNRPDCVLKTDTKATAGKAPLRNRDDRGSAHGETDQPEATTPAL